MRIVLLLLASLLLTACAGKPVVKLYEGADRPVSELLVVNIPMEMEILMINDQPVEGAAQVFTYGNRELHLAPGAYRIAAFYKNLFQINADEHEVIKTEPALFTIDGKAGDSFQIGFDAPADLEEAQAMEDNFRGWVRNEQTGEQVAGEQTNLMRDRGFISVFAAESAETVETVAPQAAIVKPATTQPATTEPTDNGQGEYLDLLKAHWNQATSAERRAFLKWISGAPAPAN